MAKWTENHIYPWMEWMRFIYATWDNINTWTVTPTSVPKFFVFTLNYTLGSLLMGFIIGLMSIPQTVEWIMKNIIDEVHKLGKVRGEGIKYHIRDFTYVMLALFVVIPFVITWGLPKLILSYREEKRLKRLQTLDRHYREEDRSRWNNYPVGDVEILWPYVPTKKDFTPKRELKAHRMIEPRTINTGNYSISFGSNNVATGNSFSLNGDVTIRIDRENNTSTAYIRTDNMT